MAAIFALLGLVAGFGAAAAQQLVESFEAATFPPTNWIRRNQSTTLGTSPDCWSRLFPPTGTDEPFAAHSGTGHAGANYNCTSGDNTISGWLISSQMTNLQNGQQVTFFTRRPQSPTGFPDRLQVRLCLDSTPDSCGAAGSTGSTSTDVGDFTTLLLDINPTLVEGGYPTTFTQQTVNLSGLPAGPNAGRIAFRYFVTSGGPNGANSNFVSIDTINVTPVELLDFSIE